MFNEERNPLIPNINLRRIGLCLQYDGASFCGWQKQRTHISVQKVLEDAISELDPLRPINAIAAGRTDSGVHAAGQVVHFDCTGPIPNSSWANALNGRLPKTIRIREAIPRPLEWHACHSAIYRRYRYTIYNGKRPNLFLSPWSWHKYQYQLDENLMRSALEELIGYHDFQAFQKAGSRRANSWTTIQNTNISRKGDVVIIEIQASGFLYGMVRLLVSQLVEIGEHKLSLKAFLQRWKEKRRDEVKQSAPAKGLCLIRAGYEEVLFPESAWLDNFPDFSLRTKDSPQKPN